MTPEETDTTPKALSDVRLDGHPLAECEMALQCSKGLYRLYVKRDVCMFHAVALVCQGWTTERFGSDDDEVEQLFYVTAYYDGVRHLEFNRDAGVMAGYIYYPDMEGIVALFQKVREIEIEVCPSL